MGTRDGRGVTLLSMPTPGRIDSELVYDGRVVRLSVDTVRFPDGSEGQVEMIRHAGASAVLPFLGGLLDPDPDVILVRQYRYASDGYLYEVPAGLPAGPEESWEECAHRELEEETGMRAATMTPLTRIVYYTGLYGRGDPAFCRDGSRGGGTLERPGRIHGSSADRFLGGAGNGPGRPHCGR